MHFSLVFSENFLSRQPKINLIIETLPTHSASKKSLSLLFFPLCVGTVSEVYGYATYWVYFPLAVLCFLFVFICLSLRETPIRSLPQTERLCYWWHCLETHFLWSSPPVLRAAEGLSSSQKIGDDEIQTYLYRTIQTIKKITLATK